ncbi:FecR domain-containing protein [Luteolibacter pohnpeiensis]|uniref:FecR domain-containing protein n=1 Tax=Luteolibacter pohnpeiensis TaxID=454153 RepID=A0A934SBI1_9BACT|nr:FecR domain-containing protein [Luteolibacter pohnpeiensis]
MNQDQFESLAQRAVEGTCKEAELKQLEAAMLESEAYRRIYLDSFLIHEMLMMEAPSLADLDEVELPETNVRLAKEHRHRKVTIGLMAAAVVLIAGLIFYFARPPVDPPTLAITPAPGSSFTTLDGSGNATSSTNLDSGSRVDLSEGTLELRFSSGVTGFVRGPAQFTVHHPMEVLLDEGSARFQVPEDAHGFKVITPELVAIDLGTEFGIVQRPGRNPQLHVFKGRVKIASKEGAGNSEILSAGNAVMATNSGNLEKIQITPDQFYQQLPSDLPFIHLSFDEGPGGALKVDGSHPAAASTVALLYPGGPGLVDGPIGKAARFNGKATPVMTNWEGVEGFAPRTICAWIKADANRPWKPYQTIAGWGDPTIGKAGKCELLLYQPTPSASTVLRLSFDQYLFSGTTNLADGKWHHVAGSSKVSADQKPIVQIYVDGKPEKLNPRYSAVKPYRSRGPLTLTRDERSMPLVIGYTDRPQAGRAFRGEIDEVYVFEAALGPERIAQLAARLRGHGK